MNKRELERNGAHHPADAKAKQLPPSVGEFAVGERDQLLARVAGLEAAFKSDPFKRERLAIQFCESRSISDSNPHSHKIIDAFCVGYSIASSEQQELAALKQPSAGVDERAAFLAGVKAASDKVKAIVEDYDYRHGVTDPDTGTREYPGNGEEWVGQMLELIEDFTGIACPKEWQSSGKPAQVMGRVYDGKAELNSIGRALSDHSPLYAEPASADVVPVPDYKRKFECLVDHAKRQDQEISRLRYDENVRRFYDEGAVWFWAGDETDNLETLACPVVINAGDLRSLLNGGRS